MNFLNIAKDFSRFPAGRVIKDGPFSGEFFRKKFLEPRLKENQKITILMDGTRGYGSSFLEEAFGGLVRAGYSVSVIKSLISLQSSDPGVLNEVWEYIDDAAIEIQKNNLKN